jgi:hypothetical protein
METAVEIAIRIGTPSKYMLTVRARSVMANTWLNKGKYLRIANEDRSFGWHLVLGNIFPPTSFRQKLKFVLRSTNGHRQVAALDQEAFRLVSSGTVHGTSSVRPEPPPREGN